MAVVVHGSARIVQPRDEGNGGPLSTALWSKHREGRDEHLTREHRMTKFYALIAACAVFAPVAITVLNQAALIVA